MRRTRFTLLFIGALMAGSTGASATPPASSGVLGWRGDDKTGYRPALVDGAQSLASAPSAVLIAIVNQPGEPATQIEANYTSFKQHGAILFAHATLTGPGGTVFEVADKWVIADSEWANVKREIRVTKAGTETAFASRVEWSLARPGTLDKADVFIPGIWYATAAHTSRSGLITDLGQHEFILRTDRLALPLVSVRDREGGWTVSIEQSAPDGATIAGDDTLGRVIDARLQYGSLGICRDEQGLRAVFVFPGSEGEQTGIFGYKPDLRTVERFHPIKTGAIQRYSFTVRAAKHAGFPTQLRAAWQSAWQAAPPKPVATPLKPVYDASIGVLDHYWYERGEVAGFPFCASLPNGVVEDPSLQMGFVGQQLPCASYLIDEGLRSKRPELIEKGEKVVEFWVKNSFNEKGVPRTWYDLEPTPHWRNYNTFLRIVTDGTSGLLRAWQIERAAGRPKPQWLAFARRVGNWLTKIQNEDGSFYREWKFDGTAASQSKTSTLHPVRLLVDLSCATGDKKYRDVALKAAEFALKANENGATYVGGTPDNPDVIDKEAGWIAMDSYLALYDVTQDKRWLDAALDAATFTETWIYAWNVPLPLDKENVGVPRVKTFVGTNLIATGHSGADNFLSFASFSYARLWIYTGDEHWLDVAKLLQRNSAQFVDTGEKTEGSLGYAVPGLQVEAFTLAVNRGHNVKIWLPWLTSATLEPMARMRETFGVIDVEAVRKSDSAELKRQNSLYARDRGYRLPAAK